MSGLESLPNAKWSIPVTPEPLIKSDLINIEQAILQTAGKYPSAPVMSWVDNTCIRVFASSDIPVAVLMSGFPNVRHPGQFFGAGLSDGKYRVNAANTDMDFDTPSTFMGNEKSSQWYSVFAVGSGATFTLLAIPWIRVKSHAYPTISLGTNLTPATGIGYGFSATSTLAGFKLYIVNQTGGSFGEIRTIDSNNTDNGTGGTITYSGGSLSLAQGDWIVLLPATNFRWIGDIFNDGSGNIRKFTRIGSRFNYDVDYSLSNLSVGTSYDFPLFWPPLARLTAVMQRFNDTVDNWYVPAAPNITSSITYGAGETKSPYPPAPILPIINGLIKIVQTAGVGPYEVSSFCNWYAYDPMML